MIQAELAKQGWAEETLQQKRKSDPATLRLAAQLRRETPPTLKWIAERLHLGTWKTLNRRLYEYRTNKGQYAIIRRRGHFFFRQRLRSSALSTHMAKYGEGAPRFFMQMRKGRSRM